MAGSQGRPCAEQPLPSSQSSPSVSVPSIKLDGVMPPGLPEASSALEVAVDLEALDGAGLQAAGSDGQIGSRERDPVLEQDAHEEEGDP